MKALIIHIILLLGINGDNSANNFKIDERQANKTDDGDLGSGIETIDGTKDNSKEARIASDESNSKWYRHIILGLAVIVFILNILLVCFDCIGSNRNNAKSLKFADMIFIALFGFNVTIFLVALIFLPYPQQFSGDNVSSWSTVAAISASIAFFLSFGLFLASLCIKSSFPSNRTPTSWIATKLVIAFIGFCLACVVAIIISAELIEDKRYNGESYKTLVKSVFLALAIFAVVYGILFLLYCIYYFWFRPSAGKSSEKSFETDPNQFINGPSRMKVRKSPSKVINQRQKSNSDLAKESEDYYRSMLTRMGKVKSISQYGGLRKPDEPKPPPPPPPKPPKREEKTKAPRRQASSESIGDTYYRQLTKQLGGKVKSISDYRRVNK